MILIGTMGGAKSEINAGLLMSKRATMTGTMLRSRALEEKIAVTRSFAAEVLPLFQQGVLRPVIDRVFPMKDIRSAHEHMERNANVGKIVLKIE
jgi:NADPH:quinone reductase-like Zn-dependent oxidoreductase